MRPTSLPLRRSAVGIAVLLLLAGCALGRDQGETAPPPPETASAPLPRTGPVPKVILISLDGAKPSLIDGYLAAGVLPRDSGLGLLRANGAVADRNITASPSLTAVSHIAIATGSTSVHNDIPSNLFEPVAGKLGGGMIGFAAPIGGYRLDPLGPARSR